MNSRSRVDNKPSIVALRNRSIVMTEKHRRSFFHSIIVLLIQSIAMGFLSGPATPDARSVVASNHVILADVNASAK